MEYKQRDWLEQLAIVEFVVNNKVYLAANVLPFIANHGRELRMRANIRRKEKIEKATEFAERMRKVQEKAGAALRKVQEEMKRQVGREKWKNKRKVIK